MYTQAYVDGIRAQIRRRLLVLGVAALLVIAAIAFSLIIRKEWLTVLLTIVGIGGLIFFYDRCITPLRKYAAHLNNCLNGRSHEVEVTFDAISPDLSMVDGVNYYAMNTFEQKGDKRFDRLFYWDAELPKPEYKPGDRLRVTYHDREIVNIVPC